MVEHTERRRFRRVPFDGRAELVDASDTVHAGRVYDLSLKGALFEAEGPWQAQVGESVRFRLELSAEAAVCMQMTVVYEKDDCIGLRCDEIDLDSITSLRRLVTLNAGDESELERDLSALARPW